MKSKNEQEINLISLLKWTLLKWRIAFVFALIVAIVFPSAVYENSLKNIRSINKIHDNPEKTITDCIENNGLNDNEVADVDDLVNYALLNEYSKDYVRNSVIFDIDPYNELIYVARYYLTLEDIPEISSGSQSITDNNTTTSSYIRNLFAMYHSSLFSDDSLKALSDASGISLNAQDIRQLISLSMSNGEVYAENFISINVVFCKGMDVDNLLSVIDDIFKQRTPEIQYVAKHSLKLVDISSHTIRDESFASVQANLLSYAVEREDDLEKKLDNLSPEQKNYYDVLHEIKIPTEEKNVSFSKFNVVIGFVLGFIVCLGIIAVLGIFKSSISDMKWIAAVYDIPVYASVERKKKKKIFGFVDSIILKIFDNDKLNMTEDEKVSMAAEKIVLSCRKESIDTVAIVSSIPGLILDEKCGIILSIVEENGIKTEFIPDVLKNASGLEKLADISCAFIFESEGKSNKKLVDSLMNCTENYNIKVLGLISM